MNSTDAMPSAITARVDLSPDDFVMANHRVHGVSVLPGVALLDLVYRVLIGHGVDSRRVELRELSMGMSGDYAAAIAAGSTLIRVGTALFGAREQRLE